MAYARVARRRAAWRRTLVALPQSAASVAPAFAHHADLPSIVDGGVTTQVLFGGLHGRVSPARAYTPLFSAQVRIDAAGASTRVPLEPDFEYAVLSLTREDAGGIDVDGQALPYGPLLYLGTGRHDLDLRGTAGACALVIGGEPFAEEMIMWWNFIGRSHDEIVAAREDWTAGRRFGRVDHEGEPLPAPALPMTPLMPRGRTR